MQDTLFFLIIKKEYNPVFCFIHPNNKSPIISKVGANCAKQFRIKPNFAGKF